MELKKKLCEFQFKIVIVGDVGVGKSALLARLLTDRFSEDYESTLFCDSDVYVAEVAGKMGIVVLWEAAGDVSNRVNLRKLYKDANGFVVVYDTTSKSSFGKVDYWLKDIAEFGPKDANVMLVGAKSEDKEGRQVDREKAARLAEQHGLSFTETSAKSGEKVKEAFATLELAIYKRLEPKLLS